MALDLATFLQYAPDAEKMTVWVHSPASVYPADEGDDDAAGYAPDDDEDDEAPRAHLALLIAQTPRQQAFVVLTTPRRYLIRTMPPEVQNEAEAELDLLPDFEQLETLLDEAALYGRHQDGAGLLYHNLLFLLLNPG